RSSTHRRLAAHGISRRRSSCMTSATVSRSSPHRMDASPSSPGRPARQWCTPIAWKRCFCRMIAMHRVLRPLVMGLFCATFAVITALMAASHRETTPACDPDNGGITLPDGFCALVVADSLGAARHLAVASNGDLYVATIARRAGAAPLWALRDA